MPTSFVKKISEESSILVMLITTINRDNELFYAYIMMEKNRWEDLLNDLKYEDIDLENYGLVLAKGYGVEPSEEVQQYIKQRKYIDDAKAAGII